MAAKRKNHGRRQKMNKIKAEDGKPIFFKHHDVPAIDPIQEVGS
jgi:hypothetical protein